MKKHTLIILLAFCCHSAFAQKQGQALIDSLISRLPEIKDDSLKYRVLSKLSDLYISIKPSEGVKYGLQRLELATKRGWQPLIADANNELGVNYFNQSDYTNATACWFAARKLYEKLGNKNGAGGVLCNIGNIYSTQKDYDKALENYLDAEKLLQEPGSEDYLATVLEDLGDVYKAKINYPKAIEYYQKSLKIRQKMGNMQGVVMTSIGLGNAYLDIGDYLRGTRYHFLALKTARDIGFNTAEAYSLASIGEGYTDMALDTMKFHYITGQNDDPNAKIDVTGHLNDTLPPTRAARLHLAIYFLTQGMDLSKKLDMGDILQSIYQSLYNTYKNKGNYILALQYHEQYLTLKDSLFNKENTKKIMEQQMSYDFDKKAAIAKVESDNELQKQKLLRNGFIGGFAVMLLFAGIFFSQRNRIRKGKKRSDELLLNILPEEVADELKAKGTSDAKLMDEVTVLFTDFKGFTQLSEKMSPKELVAEINECFSAFDLIMEKYNIEKIKTIGDSYMAAGGLPTPNKTHPEDVVKAALEIQEYMQKHRAEREAKGKPFFEIRIGINTGPVVAGIVGVKKFQYDIWGDTVNTASRMESSGEAGKVNVSGATYELVKDKFTFTYRGKIQAKGKGEVDMYFVEGEIA